MTTTAARGPASRSTRPEREVPRYWLRARTSAVAPLASTRSGHSSITAFARGATAEVLRSEEHTSELQSLTNLVCRLLLEKKKNNDTHYSKTRKFKKSNNEFVAVHDT